MLYNGDRGGERERRGREGERGEREREGGGRVTERKKNRERETER